MSIEKNVQIVKNFLAALGRRDKQGLLALSAEDIEWIIPGENWPLAGTHRGHAGLENLLQKANETVETSFPEPPEFIAQGDRVLVIGFARGRKQILVIPNKRQPRRLIGFLTYPEVEALLAAPDQRTWSGRRDHTFLLLAVQTGLRLSEVSGLRRQDVILGTGAHVYCLGKGRKERRTPLAKRTVDVLHGWLREPSRGRDDIVFPNARGGRLSADGAQYLLAKHLATARQNCPSLREKRVTLHVLRHTTAMALLQGGVDTSSIALWLGHESPATTHIYLDANLALKEQILAKMGTWDGTKIGRYRPEDPVLKFLKSL